MSLKHNVRSHNALFVVFKFHDDWLDILAVCLPLLDALLCVRVEVLLLLVQQSLGFACGLLVSHELLCLKPVFGICLALQEI